MQENTIGENIRKIRKQKHYTQKQLAMALGISVATLSSYETGKTYPTLDLICKMATLFKTTTDSIVNLIQPHQDLENIYRL